MSPVRTSFTREKPTFSGISRALFQGGCSSEQAVDEPGWKAAAPITNQTLAIDPVAAAIRVLDAVIVAQPRRRWLPPPFGRDPLGSFDTGDVMDGAPPHEPPRHAFRRRINDVYRLGAVKQALRPLRRWKRDRFGLGERTDPPARPLREVALHRLRPLHGARAELHRQPIDQPRQFACS